MIIQPCGGILIKHALFYRFTAQAHGVHSGTVVGWVHRPAAFVIEKRLGKGKLVISTFRLMRDAFDAAKRQLEDYARQL